MNKIRKYGTSEIPLAAYLVMHENAVVDIDTSSFKAQFIFENVDKSLIDEYTYDEAQVNPKKFANVMSGLFRRAKQS